MSTSVLDPPTTGHIREAEADSAWRLGERREAIRAVAKPQDGGTTAGSHPADAPRAW